MVLWNVPLFPLGFVVLMLGGVSVLVALLVALVRKTPLGRRAAAGLAALSLSPLVAGFALTLVGLALADETARAAESLLGPSGLHETHDELVVRARASAWEMTAFGLKATLLPVAATGAVLVVRRRRA